MRTLFTRFLVERNSDDDRKNNLVDDIADLCWEWVKTQKRNLKLDLSDKWKKGITKISPNDEISINDDIRKNNEIDIRFWRMDIKQLIEDNDEIVNYLFIAKKDEIVEFSLLQDITSREGVSSPNYKNVWPPVIIRQIISNFNCKYNSESIQTNWDSVSSSNSEYLIDMILDKNRFLPLVLVSKSFNDNKYLINKMGKFSGKLAGLAHIKALQSTNTSRVRKHLGKQWISNGSIRIYWPGITREELDQEERWRQLYGKSRFEKEFGGDEELLMQDIVNSISESTRNIRLTSPFLEKVRFQITKIDEDIIQKEEEQKRDEIFSKLNTAEEKIRYLKSSDYRLNDEIRKLKSEKYSLSEKILISSEKIAGLENRYHLVKEELKEFNNMKYLLKSAYERNPDKEELIEHVNKFGIEEHEEEPDIENEFGNISEAILAAKRDFSSRIVFLDTSIKSAFDATSDTDPNTVYDIFKILYEEVWKLMKKQEDGKLASNNKKFNIQNVMNDNFGYGRYAESENSHISNKKSGLKGRWFQYNKSYLQILPHIKCGNKMNKALRIHVLCLNSKQKYKCYEEYFDSNNKKIRKNGLKEIRSFPSIIIGWCGNHL